MKYLSVLGVFLASVAFASEVQTFDVDGSTVKIETFDRARILTISNPKFHEMDVDTYGTGIADIRELSAGNDRIRYSMPSKKGYLYLEVQRRLKTGFLTAEFALANDGKHYKLIRRAFRPFEVLNLPLFEMPSGGCDENSRLGLTNPLSPWALPADIVKQIRSSSMLDPGCSKEPFAKDFPALLKAVSDVAGSANDPKRRYVSCLVDHHQGYYAGRLEAQFEQMLAVPKATLYCSEKSYGVVANYSENSGVITLNKTRAQVPDLDYGAVTFHESLHMAGIKDENVVLAMVACCSKPAGTAHDDCMKMDKMLELKTSQTAHMIAYSKDLEGFDELVKTIQDNSNEQIAETVFNDYLESMHKLNRTARSTFADCMKKGGDDTACGKQVVAQSIKDTTNYLRTTCPSYFPNHKDVAQICSKVIVETKNLLANNAERVCDPDAPTPFQRTCLMTAQRDAKAIYEKIRAEHPEDWKTSGIAPIVYVDVSPAAIKERERIVISYLVALNRNIKGVLNFWDEFKQSAEVPRAEAMIATWFKKLTENDRQGYIPKYFAKCEKDPKASPSHCAEQLKEYMDISIQQFFSKTCPTYFTQLERRQAECEEYGKSFEKVIDANIEGGCSTTKQDDSKLAAAGLNFNCINRGLDQAKNDYDHWDPKRAEKTDIVKDWLAVNSKYEKNKEALASVNEKANTEDLNTTSNLSVINFDPSNLDSVRQVIAQQNNTANDILNTAGSAMDRIADAVEPKAIAAPVSTGASNYEPSSSAQESPSTAFSQPSTPSGFSIPAIPAASSPSTATSTSANNGPNFLQPANPNWSSPARAPAAANPAAPTLPSTPSQAQAPAASAPQPTSAAESAPASRPGSIATTPSSPESGNSIRSGSQPEPALAKSESGAEKETQFLDYVESHLQEVHDGSLRSELERRRIQIIDADGLIFGSEHPKIQLIWSKKLKRFTRKTLR